MKKLTDQQIRDAVNGVGLNFTHPDLTVARAIEAEVLRLNGFDEDGVHEAEKVCMEAYQVVGSLLSDVGKFETDEAEKILDNLIAGKLVHKDVLPWPSVELGSWPDEKPSEKVYKSADELFDALGIDTKPRATGCPETMDETAEIAVASKQAGEEKSPPATGPAG
jgi:hypothetical protein